eukprot:CAMPEP_0171678754 /NCGR_PEP_ID=MMETSP0990-20121206/55854_1 /TAXON_ID=483369 /ORGANISM="non described non described, Strain CCMP2098" /LENGTH=73 /DNA_ID=CAMNT_0012265457 /DNA_START=65 /DNA_END=287 /DNA_ORIENTATION=+
MRARRTKDEHGHSTPGAATGATRELATHWSGLAIWLSSGGPGAGLLAICQKAKGPSPYAQADARAGGAESRAE